jgi:microcystin-dependent protein
VSQSFIGEIKMFGGNFAPRGFARCDGQLMPISQNEALFSLIGTTYGGDGQNTFGMPDLRGRIPVHQSGSNPMGLNAGNEQVTLSSTHMPVHNHNLNAGAGGTKSSSPANAVFASGGVQQYASNRVSPLSGNLAVGLAPTGGGLAHNNMMPYAVLTFIIALEGIYPSRN